MDVYLLWHSHEFPGGETDAKLIGVYATSEDADQARQRAVLQPGFRDTPSGFVVDRYRLGEDNWTEGFVADPTEDMQSDEE